MHGCEVILQDTKKGHGAAWKSLGVKVASTMPSARQRAASRRGEEGDRRLGGLGQLEEGGLRPRREVSLCSFLFLFFFSLLCWPC